MAKAEHPEKYNWWLNELDLLGISTLQKNGLSNHKEVSDLTEAVKQKLYEDSVIQVIQQRHSSLNNMVLRRFLAIMYR
jgi:hypothetical protein